MELERVGDCKMRSFVSPGWAGQFPVILAETYAKDCYFSFNHLLAM